MEIGRILFLDDQRIPEDIIPGMMTRKDVEEVVIANNYNEFCEKVELYEGEFGIVCFDHDLGDQSGEREYTGKDAAYYLLMYAFDHDLSMPRFIVHSSNPQGCKRIRGMLQKYAKEIPLIGR